MDRLESTPVTRMRLPARKPMCVVLRIRAEGRYFRAYRRGAGLGPPRFASAPRVGAWDTQLRAYFQVGALQVVQCAQRVDGRAVAAGQREPRVAGPDAVGPHGGAAAC